MFYMFLAPGFEETEALATLDFLRRAKIEISTVGVSDAFVTGSHNITVKADIQLADADISACTGVILPGGMPGTNNLYACDTVLEAVKTVYAKGLPVCAICAAPLILGRLGILSGRNAICYPGFENELKGAKIADVKSVTDGNVITAKAAGAVCEFAYNIITYVVGEETAKKVIGEIYY